MKKWIALGALIPFAGAWILTQPIWPTTSPSHEPPQSLRLSLSRHVYAIADVLSPRSWEHKENLETVAGYIAHEWENAGLEAQQQEFTTQDGKYKNVFVELGPDTEDVIIVGAHYDAFGPLPGADDNASGVSALIELTKELKRQRFSRRVILIAFALEEPPHFRSDQMGSRAHAKIMAKLGKNVKAMLSLEMLGYYSDEPGSQDFPYPGMGLVYPTQGNFLALVGDLGQISLTRQVKNSFAGATALPVRSINAPSWVAGIDFSDHASYWREGFPAIMVTDTAYYRNKAYHTKEDRPERLDYKRLALSVQGLTAAVTDLANE